MRRKPIYVELVIRAPFDALWRHTQDPALHERWDLRFTRIEYLPKATPDEAQRFLYETRIGFGLRVAGTGESRGARNDGQTSVSALAFRSDDPKSIIRDGSGYWKYVETADGVRFLTLYDYETRYGLLGSLFDWFVFRPLLGWATAWSFDRLRLWLERGVDPALTTTRAFAHTLCRSTIACVWVYHGLVPKVVLRHEDEVAFIRLSGLFAGHEHNALIVIGLVEALFGVTMLVLWRARWLYTVAATILITLLVGAASLKPAVVVAPFNPLSLTAAMLALCAIGWIACRELPSAQRCLRKQPKGRA